MRCARVGGVFHGPSRGVHATTRARTTRKNVQGNFLNPHARVRARVIARTRASPAVIHLESPRGFLSRSTVVIHHHDDDDATASPSTYLQLGELPRSTSLGPAPAASPAPDLNISPALAAPRARMMRRRRDDDADARACVRVERTQRHPTLTRGCVTHARAHKKNPLERSSRPKTRSPLASPGAAQRHDDARPSGGVPPRRSAAAPGSVVVVVVVVVIYEEQLLLVNIRTHYDPYVRHYFYIPR